MELRRWSLGVAVVLVSCLGAGPAVRAGELWPDLSLPPQATGGGEKDAAVIVGAENYVFVPKVPGARLNADAWHSYLTGTLNIPVDRVALLLDNEATLEKIRKYAVQKASEVEPGGTLWFLFIGHGAPAKDGSDGILVGSDAQQDADALFARSLRRAELLSLLARGRQARTVVLLDACFSGRAADGEPLVKGLQPLVTVTGRPAGVDQRTVLLSAAKSDQFAGPLPKSATLRPAFSYLALGALRGWARDARGRVTAGGLIEFARRALTLDKGRTQTPELSAGRADTVLGRGSEPAPDLGKIDREGAAGPDFAISAPDLPAMPGIEAPGELGPVDRQAPDYRRLDLEALKSYDETVKTDKSDASPSRKAIAWRLLGRSAPAFAERAEKRAAQWDRFAEAQWSAEEALRKRAAARDADWKILSQLLGMDTDVVPEAQKTRWAREFQRAYRSAPGIDPGMAADLAKHAPEAPPVDIQISGTEEVPAQAAAGPAGLPSASAADIAGWKEDEKDCAKCCTDQGGSWRPASYTGDRYGPVAERENFWGCCSGADFHNAYASCRAAGRGVFRDVGRDWFRCARP